MGGLPQGSRPARTAEAAPPQIGIGSDAIRPSSPDGTFSPQAGRRRMASTLTPPSPRLRGEGKDEGLFSKSLKRSSAVICAFPASFPRRCSSSARP
ncbi:hypothetical protein EET67_19595 [Pseudaminobacter arsenicus]|uniref:Uncharacterized protein n=1 Tax=Borborobacter arsenicus TaxID=1851146 RepID=A0A432V1X5_9HYPH|nr:hypothetical protein EET67_19595 [Pseudaminobacter arsenicus]